MRKLFNLLILLTLSLAANAQVTQTFSTSGTFTVPANVTSITVEAWGSGGSGGGALGATAGGGLRAMGGGGGGGAYSTAVVSVTPGQMISYTVAPQTAASTTTTVDGTPSSFLTVTAAGGKGGQAVAVSGAHIGGAGGAGGSGTFNGGTGGSGVGYAGSTTRTQPGGRWCRLWR